LSTILLLSLRKKLFKLTILHLALFFSIKKF
jgi:hypothetical protein